MQLQSALGRLAAPERFYDQASAALDGLWDIFSEFNG
jgi:hypothetical protein